MSISFTKDPSNFWVNVQEKTFSKWLNSKLKARDLVINDLVKDLSDGVSDAQAAIRSTPSAGAWILQC